MKSVLRTRAAMASQRASGLPPQPALFSVATDFSGLESPLWALQIMGLPHVHVSSCDWSPACRAWIEANFPPCVMFDDVLRRDHSMVPKHDVYVAGFPCTPFSTLHVGSRFLDEPDAKQFFAAVDTIRQCSPRLAVLENVLGGEGRGVCFIIFFCWFDYSMFLVHVLVVASCPELCFAFGRTGSCPGKVDTCAQTRARN